MVDYQALCRQLEAVECSIPTVGLVEETEERLIERISLYQVTDQTHINKRTHAVSRWHVKYVTYPPIWLSLCPSASEGQPDGASTPAVPGAGGGKETSSVSWLL